MILPEKATQPTMYFIGVTTKKSSIMKVFPEWAKALELGNAVIKGIDMDLHADPEQYREVVNFIKNDPLSLGALVTTHKIDLYQAAHDLFDYLDPHARRFCELSSISKKEGKLEGHAKDPITSGLAMEAFLPENFWLKHGGEVFILGAGGSALAISSYLSNEKFHFNIPSKITMSNRSQPRLNSARQKLEGLNPRIQFEYRLCETPEQNDEILRKLKPWSLIINATGLGKDRPGSPLSDQCSFPEHSLVWEINYRGDLKFMHQANAQREAKKLQVEDGWIYFIHGWTQVIAEVFHTEITVEKLTACENIALKYR